MYSENFSILSQSEHSYLVPGHGLNGIRLIFAGMPLSNLTSAFGRFPTRPIAEPVARHHHLSDDFARREIAHQPLRAGVTERASERAADLARHAQRRAP